MNITLTPDQISELQHGHHDLHLTHDQLAALGMATPPAPHTHTAPSHTVSGHYAPAGHTVTGTYTPAGHSHAPSYQHRDASGHDPHGSLGQSVSWQDFFGHPLDFHRSRMYMTPAYTRGRIIPVDGIAIAFDIPAHERGTMSIQSVETNVVRGSRFGTISKTPLDWHGLSHQSWGTGNTLTASVNYADPRTHLVLHPGRYYLNLKNNHPRADKNYFIARCYVTAHK